MPIATDIPQTHYETHYDPVKVINDPEFRILSAQDPILSKRNVEVNISCAYNPDHVVHMIQKPMPKAGKGEVVVHVRATGICGYVRGVAEDVWKADL
jgi:L-iditol 2-dehydrogenase